MKKPITYQTPRELGVDAFDARCEPDCNPFDRGTNDRLDWFQGYYGRFVDVSAEKARKALGLDDDETAGR